MAGSPIMIRRATQIVVWAHCGRCLVDFWINEISKNHTARSISELSHDYGWEVAKNGELLPLKAYLAKRIRPPELKDEIDWARSEAARLGLK